MNSDEHDIDRRTILKASSVAVTAGAIPTPVSGNQDGNHDDETSDSVSQPDIEIYNNSRSDEPIKLHLSDTDTGDVLHSVKVATRGLNHPESSEVPVEERMSEAKKELDLSDIDHSGQISVEATIGDQLATTSLTIRNGGIEPEVTAKVFVGPDGSISAYKSILCGNH